MAEALTEERLRAAYSWEELDRVAGRPAMTDFRRRIRYHQAMWREAQGHPIGTHPIAPKPGGDSRPLGSRLPLDYAWETGANFMTTGAFEAVRARTSSKEPHQSFDHQRLWADLLWTPALAFNLFGDLAADVRLADRAVHAWWPDAPGKVAEVRFVHSPGRFDQEYTANLVDLDAAFVLDLEDGTRGIIGIDIYYHERLQREIPKPTRLVRYLEVTEKSGAFGRDAVDAVNATPLTVMWLRHLLVLSMLQHPGGAWSWGRFVVVHAAGNSDYATASARYRDLLLDESTFSSMTIEELLDSAALPAKTAKALRRRYVPN